ncbi:MAG: 2-dehydropantoate 2-reductase, partial [Acidobacteria bacterium]|nr:2-dehydropantoate 2-reductase [Acidobacteriota bacterium]
MIRICIIGCGAVGSLFAAHLARAGEAEVWAYDVSHDHIQTIRQHGFRLSGAVGFTARVSATTE